MNTDLSADSLAFRLKHFIDSLGMNTTTFADKCGIPRPSFSQIITGRNQKVSNLLIGKIHETYPDLSLYWLMFGQGEMLVSRSSDSFEPELNPDAPDMDVPVAPYTDVVIATSPSHEREIPADDPQMQTEGILNDRKSFVIMQQLVEQQKEMLHLLQKIKDENEVRLNVSERKVASITIFYDDSSFETFVPGR